MSNLEEDLRSRLTAAQKNTARIEQDINISKSAMLKLIKDLEDTQRYEGELEYVLNTLYSPPPGDFA